MSESERLNEVLRREAPAAFRCLSELGLRAAFPMGNPAQSAQARGTRLNATIGQVTDGRGGAVPIEAMRALVPALDPEMAFLYSPQAGHSPLRKAWHERQRSQSGGSTVPTSMPILVHGLTQGLSFVADLFADADTDVVLPTPTWENYELLFTMRLPARIHTYDYYAGSSYNVAGLAAALEKVRTKGIVVLGFPGNPTGYTPTAEEGRRIAEIVTAHPGPLVIAVDDAYAGLIYEPGLQERSLFWEIAERSDPERHFVVRVDGATKELFFFPGRVGFLTHDRTGAAEEALASKFNCVGRGTVSGPPGPSQAIILQALRDPLLEAQIADRVADMKSRYEALRDALRGLGSPWLKPLPFNSGLFALVRVDGAIDADHLRRHLIEKYSVGTIVIPEVNALRIAFCSVRSDEIPELVDRIAKAATDLAP
jgi:aspartate/methionine/tyrosine aminotransferase